MKKEKQPSEAFARLGLAFLLAALTLAGPSAFAFTVNLTVQGTGTSDPDGFWYLVEEDTTNHTQAGVGTAYSIALDIHKSHAPVVLSGQVAAGNAATLDLPDGKRYYISVLPSGGFQMGGVPADGTLGGAKSLTIRVNPHPVPTAQISVLVFQDHWPISNVADGWFVPAGPPPAVQPQEPGLPGFHVIVFDTLGQVMQDAFANPLGTTYQLDVNGNPLLDLEGNPTVDQLGDGNIITDANGQARVRFLAPGKYGVRVVQPYGSDWVLTSTIEGTPTVDAWVKANESPDFIEGFGTGFAHVFFGFVSSSQLPWAVTPPGGSGSITGRLVIAHFSKPPWPAGMQTFSGWPVSEGWVGLNDLATGQGLYAAPTDVDGNFTISGVPPGTYQLVTWDRPLDTIFGFSTVTVGPGESVALGDVRCVDWFGHIKGTVFRDVDLDGFPDPGEPPMPQINVNLRYRDGSIYQAQTTDGSGEYDFAEVFPFFKWQVMEIDFARFKATGITYAVDAGGAIPADNGWVTPSRDLINPAPWTDPPNWPNGTSPATLPLDNPHTGNNLSQTETGAVLTKAFQVYLGQGIVADWGKDYYAAGENGGISGVIFYATTRAEDDPRYGTGDPWEPGIPRVQVALYLDADVDGRADDLDGDDEQTLADVDNWPFATAPAEFPGQEDVDRNGNGIFDPGDAVQIATSDSWDDNAPTDCLQILPVVHGMVANPCFDNFATWNQLKDGVFDGGYAFNDYYPVGLANVTDPEAELAALVPGFYIVEASPPPGYELQKEEDKNVMYGDPWVPNPTVLPPLCFGDVRPVPAELSLFPGEPAPFAGEPRPLCDRKRVVVRDQQNTAADFHMFTYAPKAARGVGFINNDLGVEFDPTSPVFGEKAAPKWLPISVQDWKGNEVNRVYCDEYGAYNFLLPSTYSVNVPSPTGVSPQMATIYLNHPYMDDPNNPGQKVLDPFYDPSFSQMAWTFQYFPGSTSYLDTPIVPVAAFTNNPRGQVDAQPADGVPVVNRVDGPLPGGGPIVCDTGQQVTIRSQGTLWVPNPDYDPNLIGSPATVQRDFGFGATSGEVTVGGVQLGIVSWADDQIVASIPAGLATGQLMVTRGDNGKTTSEGVTLWVVPCSATNVRRVPTSLYPTIQSAIDASVDGDIILVAPGTYNENPIVYKKVRLQGAGAASTIVYATPQPTDRLTAWKNKLASLIAAGDCPAPIAPTSKEAPGFFVVPNPGRFDASDPALIDGFTITGSLAGGGIYVDDHAHYLEISNCVIKGNQGSYGGGITVGTDNVEASNTEVHIHHNRIVQNGGITGGGGVTIYTGSSNYLLADNTISGNFSRGSGGGVAHIGLSDGGRIERNHVSFNETFQGVATGGHGAGIFLSGELAGGVALSAGAGDVTLDSNLIQGNVTASGMGGGVRAFAFNGLDVQANPATPANWHALNLFNNIIVNNASGWAGAGVSLQDVAKARILGNTIAHNDSTATSINAFEPGQQNSQPTGSGIVGHAHSIALQAAFGAGYEQAYSSPALHDNILWHNRSFSWDQTLNGGLGGLTPDPGAPQYRDLEVRDTPVPSALDPQFCILSDTSGYAPTNQAADPQFSPGGYFNTLYAGKVADEGGTNIHVRFTPLYESAGNYHIAPTSPARNAAGGVFEPLFAEMGHDFDQQIRPSDGAYDVGADEIFIASPLADLSIAKSSATSALLLGGTYTVVYGLAVQNLGPDNAPEVTVTDTLPAGATFVSAIASQGTVGEAGGVVTAGLGSISSGGSAMISITIDITPAANFTNASTVEATGASPPVDPNLANNASDWTISVFAPPLAPVANLTLQAGGPIPNAGQAQTLLAWAPPASLGGCATVTYDVLRSTSPSVFTDDVAVCVATDLSATTAADAEAIMPGQVFYYLVRAENACGSSLGTTSGGSQRTGRTCP